jgi:hypothetical protein
VKNVLNEKTLIPVSGLAVFAGFCFWLTMAYATIQENKASISRLGTVTERLARIEGKIDVLMSREQVPSSSSNLRLFQKQNP